MKFSVLVFLSLFLIACASSKQYAGPDQPDHKLATLTYSEISDVKVLTINENGNTAMGLGLGGGFIKEFKLLPGDQTVTAAFNPQINSKGIQCDLSFAEVAFTAEADSHYQIQYSVRAKEWDVWVQNLTEGKSANQKKTFPLKVVR